MGMNETPSAERVHISFFGCRNAGKSSLLNAVTGQDLAIVSSIKGTTTDPVKKSMELLPLGPVVIIDTPGIDDDGTLGELRIRKTKQILNRTDIAVLVADSQTGLRKEDRELIALFEEKEVPYLIAMNKADLRGDGADTAAERGQERAGIEPAEIEGEKIGTTEIESAAARTAERKIIEIESEKRRTAERTPAEIKSGNTGIEENETPENKASEMDAMEPGAAEPGKKPPLLYVSALTGRGIPELKEAMAHLRDGEEEGEDSRPLIGDLLSPSDLAVLVIPVDKAAPKGRLILPQQQTIRGILDAGATAVMVKDDGLSSTLSVLGKRPRLVVTDSQVFGKVKNEVPADVLLTSFSILFARYKGNLKTAAEGAAALDRLKDGDTVLICEGCTHHRQCGDIGTEKLPAWLRKHTGKELRFSFTSGGTFPDDLSPYSLIVHCGGCMLNAREMKYRLKCAQDQKIPMTNYGIAIAHMNGILKRSVEPFPDIWETL